MKRPTAQAGVNAKIGTGLAIAGTAAGTGGSPGLDASSSSSSSGSFGSPPPPSPPPPTGGRGNLGLPAGIVLAEARVDMVDMLDLLKIKKGQFEEQ